MQVGAEFYTYLLMEMEQTEYSETSAYKIQTPGNYPEENIQHTEHGESLKSRILYAYYIEYYGPILHVKIHLENKIIVYLIISVISL